MTPAQPARPTVPRLLAACSLLLYLAAFWRTLAWLLTTWLGDPYYSHGLLVPLLAAYLAWRLRAPAGKPAFAVGLLTVGVAYALQFLALSRSAYLLSSLALLLGLAGLTLLWRGWAGLRRWWFPLTFLMLAIPLPILERWTPALAQGVAQASGTLARLLGIPVLVEGARLLLPSAELVVGAPCSGVNSLAALVTLAALYAFVLSGPRAHRWALFLLSVPVALLANLLRVTLLLVVAELAGPGAALRLFHDASGIVLFVLAVGLLLMLGRLLRCSGLRSDL
jgi:exosortase